MKQQKNHYPHLQINTGFLLGLSGRQRQTILGDFFFPEKPGESKSRSAWWGGCGGGDECIFSSRRGLKPGQYLQPGYLLKFSCDLSVLLLVFPLIKEAQFNFLLHLHGKHNHIQTLSLH